ncbi:hypothetical protein [Anabaena subtropica]|uniref:Uncharacterized protein n=1 Tax=Anabaena subtropica FACHB-260 TaxID=2692884 RepID=A0ABR8CQ89_9NOST|nr:hypothetical protein [Anabaena subtropica]MBD2345336.1 hypothetical protein [Anabaena subtropica FACHB-260]
MMQPLATSPGSTPRLQQFLDLVDRLAEARGQKFPPIVEIEKLRSLPQLQPELFWHLPLTEV